MNDFTVTELKSLTSNSATALQSNCNLCESMSAIYLERSSSGSKISLSNVDGKKTHLFELLGQHFAKFLWLHTRGYDSHGQDVNLADAVITVS